MRKSTFLTCPLAERGHSTLGKMPATVSLIAVVSLVFLCGFPVLSWAHAFPDHSDPKVGATLNSSPTMVRIWFDSDLEPSLSKITVHNANDKTVDKGDSRVDATDPKLLEVSVPTLPPGQYRVIWHVVSKDGHRTNGDFTFKVK
jgi:methionine-rich copper-binding protein CopC